MPSPAIDVNRAMALREAGMTWKAIGIQLAQEDGRETPYGGTAVYSAVRRYRWRTRSDNT